MLQAFLLTEISDISSGWTPININCNIFFLSGNLHFIDIFFHWMFIYLAEIEDLGTDLINS